MFVAVLDTLVKLFSDNKDFQTEVESVMNPPKGSFSQMHEIIFCA